LAKLLGTKILLIEECWKQWTVIVFNLQFASNDKLQSNLQCAKQNLPRHSTRSGRRTNSIDDFSNASSSISMTSLAKTEPKNEARIPQNSLFQHGAYLLEFGRIAERNSKNSAHQSNETGIARK
jgi:hypothetical protein